PWQSNHIVVGMGTVLASLMKGDDDSLGYWAVGEDHYDEKTTKISQVKSLKKQILRKRIIPNRDIIFSTGDKRSTSPTNILEINMILSINDFGNPAPEKVTLKEFGLLSKSGQLVNYVPHEGYKIKAGATAGFSLRFTF
ncbi:MAG: hypothetical protein WBM44_12690, partial [Waterburya sp.]